MLLLLLSRLRLLGDGRHGSWSRAAGHEDELRGHGGPQGAVHLQDMTGHTVTCKGWGIRLHVEVVLNN